ncbi:hypothetical protein L3Q82_012771, partial [Scortum barcoo]
VSSGLHLTVIRRKIWICLTWKKFSASEEALLRLLPVVKAAKRALMEPAGVRWLIPGLRKYPCELTFDTDTVHRKIKLSYNNRKVTHVEEEQPYPDRPERMDQWPQLLCRNSLTSRCYWEVEWSGRVDISVSYRGIRRKGGSVACAFGENNQSWTLTCSDGLYSVCHNKKRRNLSYSSSSSSSSSSSLSLTE